MQFLLDADVLCQFYTHTHTHTHTHTTVLYIVSVQTVKAVLRKLGSYVMILKFCFEQLQVSKERKRGTFILLLLTPQPGGLACWDPRLPCSMSLKLRPWLCISLAKFPSSCLCPPMGRGAPLSWEIGWCRPRRQGVGWGDPCLCIQTDGGRLPDKSSQVFLLIKSLKNVTALKSRIFKGWQRTASDPGRQPFVLFHTTGPNNGVIRQHRVS